MSKHFPKKAERFSVCSFDMDETNVQAQQREEENRQL